MAEEDTVATCRQLLAARDRDLLLSSNYANAGDRPRLVALFAFMTELRRIPSLVSEPGLGEIRLQWWREALDEILAGKTPRAHPVVLALSQSGAINAQTRAIAETLIDARARLLYEPAFASLCDLGDFLGDAEAPLAALALGAGQLDELSRAHALARFAPHCAPGLSGDAAAAALKLLDSGRGFAALDAAQSGCVAYLALTRAYARRPDGRDFPLVKRALMFRAVLTGRA